MVPRERVREPLLDDAQILAAVRCGNPSGASALYRRARPQVDRTIGRILGGRDADHDDLAQLSMIEIVRSMQTFRGECSLDTWISRVTARLVFRELKRRRCDSHVFDRASSIEQANAPTDVAGDAAIRSTLGRIRRHLDAIEPMKAWAVVLHDVCGYDLREVAEITETTVSAAQSRVVRGRTELHERIEADPELADALENLRGRS